MTSMIEDNAATSLSEVGRAADALVAAFASHDVRAYFASFAPDATFVFHPSPEVLGSRAEYEAEWATWETEGFHVESCETSDRRLALVSDDVAIMTHSVRTRLAGLPEVQRERESIVFRRSPDGMWLAVHEHLSPEPGEDP